jgi:Na+/H+ antiporter
LPPLLYSAAWFTSWKQFKESIRPITLLAFGCVLGTSAVVGWVAEALIPGFTFAMGFLLGAIISPPDAVAAITMLRNTALPQRVKVILEGESLVNDAAALIAFRFALIAVSTGTFSLTTASIQFTVVSIGGIAIGIAAAFIVFQIHKFINNTPTVDTALTLFTPFISYLAAERLHVSGVLAVVTTGLLLTRKSSILFSYITRIQAVATWKTLTFIIEGIVFLLIGLQIHFIIEHFTIDQLWENLGYGLIISLTVVVFRMLWVFPGAYLPRMLSKKIREKESETNWRAVFFTGFTGIRGVVSLAAALAIPFTMENGQPFPGRETIIFITFCVIIYTLVVHGLMLPFVIKWLKISSDGKEHKDEIALRRKLAFKAISHIEREYSYNYLSDSVLGLIKSKYEVKLSKLFPAKKQFLLDSNEPKELMEQDVVSQFQNIQGEMIKFEREFLIQLRKEGSIDDEVFRKLEYELDLEETRLQLDAVQLPLLETDELLKPS